MKKIAFLTLTFFAFTFSFAGADDVIGVWLTQDKDGQITIYKQDGKYFGKLTWMKEPNYKDGTPKLDKNNPDEKLRSKPLQNTILISDFEYDEDNEWEDGEIYDPTSGKTYSCVMKLLNNNTLEVTGYIGFSFIGKTVVWTRVK